MRPRITGFFRPLRRDRPWRGFAAGCVLIVLAAAARWSLGNLSEGFGPMMLLPAILLSGVIGGARAGLAVALLCTLVAWTWFFPPYGSFGLEFRAAVTMAIFVLTAAFELYIVATLNLAMDDLARARERSQTMFRELQHRVANNLQFVAGVLRMGARGAGKEGQGLEALARAQSRLELMSRVHRRLHDPEAVDLPIGHHLEEVCRDLVAASDVPFVRLEVTADPLVLDLESRMSVSLLIAELVTNSLKHAFVGRTEGHIVISVVAGRGTAMLTVADDGVGLPVQSGDAKSGRLGRGIVESLAAQLHGKLAYERANGTVARLTFSP